MLVTGSSRMEESERPTRTRPVPSARSASARGGRLGPRAYDVLASPQHADGSSGRVGLPSRRSWHRTLALPSERAAVAER